MDIVTLVIHCVVIVAAVAHGARLLGKAEARRLLQLRLHAKARASMAAHPRPSGTVVVRLTADTSNFARQVDRLQRSVEDRYRRALEGGWA